MLNNMLFLMLSLLCLMLMFLFGSYVNEIPFEEYNKKQMRHKTILCSIYFIIFFFLACFFGTFVEFK